jgi:hypothetical protein
MFLGRAAGMDRKVKKLTDVLVFADSAGLKYVIYFYQWFEEMANEMSERSGHETTMLMSAASRVLKKLFITKVRSLSAFNSDQRMSAENSLSRGRKTANDIRKMLIDELTEVTQEAHARQVLQTRHEMGYNSESDSQNVVLAAGPLPG